MAGARQGATFSQHHWPHLLLVQWSDYAAKSVGQRWQAISSTDAETYALSQAMYEGISIRGHTHQFGIDQPRPTNIKCDNLGGVQIANSDTL